jgi:hypothetical protein
MADILPAADDELDAGRPIAEGYLRSQAWTIRQASNY